MSDLSDLKLRMAALELEAMTAAGLSADAVGYFTYWQETFPYFTHRTGPASYEWDSEDMQVVRRVIIVRAVCAHWNEGYQGTPDALVDNIIDVFSAKIANAMGLTSTGTYAIPPTYLYSEAPVLTDDTGYRVFNDLIRQNSYQAGVEFTVNVPMLIEAS